MPRPPFHPKPLDYASIVGFLAYSASAVITPICLVIMAGELQFSLTAGGTLEFARGVIIFGVLFVSGFASARFGKARSLGWSLLLQGVAMLGYSLAPNYPIVLLATCVMGLGAGIVEGLINPLIQELHRGDSGRYLNLVNAFWSVGVLLTVLLAGELLTRDVSWRLLIGAVGVFSIAAAILFFILSPTENHAIVHGHADVLRHKLDVMRSSHFWLFFPIMFTAGAAEGAFTFWSASFIQLNYDALPRAGGIGTATFAGGMMIGRFASAYLVRQHHLRRLILLSALAGTFVSLAVPFVGSLGQLYLVLFFAGLSVACLWPTIQSYAVDRMPQVDATALDILLSCAGIPGFASIAWLMGWVADQASLRTSFMLVPATFVLLGILMLIESRRTTPPPIPH